MSLPDCTYRTKMAERNHCANTRLRGFPLDLVPDKVCAACIWRAGVEDRRPVPSWFVVGKTLVVFQWAQLFRWGDAVAKVARAVGIKPATGCGCGRRREKLNRWGAAVARWWLLKPRQTCGWSLRAAKLDRLGARAAGWLRRLFPRK